MMTEVQRQLFAGEVLSSGDLSNETQLARICKRSRKVAKWVEFVRWVISQREVDTSNWEFHRHLSKSDRQRRTSYFKALLKTPKLSPEEVEVIACHMLSEMLEEMPERVPVPVLV